MKYEFKYIISCLRFIDEPFSFEVQETNKRNKVNEDRIICDECEHDCHGKYKINKKITRRLEKDENGKLKIVPKDTVEEFE